MRKTEQALKTMSADWITKTDKPTLNFIDTDVETIIDRINIIKRVPLMQVLIVVIYQTKFNSFNSRK